MVEHDENIRVKGVVLAGVHRWDKCSFEGVMPRPLVPIGHWPLISYVLGWLREGGVADATICANSASRMVRMCLGDGAGLGMDLNYYEDWIPRGPAGCVRDAGLIGGAEVLVILEATSIPLLDLRDLLRTHQASGAAVTAVLSEEASGGNDSRRVLSPAGIYVFSRRALDFIQETGYHDIKEVLIPKLHERGQRVGSYITADPCLRVRDAWSYLAVNEWVLERLSDGGERLADYRTVGDGQVHRSAELAQGVHLVGPVLIGPGAVVGKDVTIVGPTSIGAHCEIEAGAVICRSVIWDRCRVGRRSYLDRCMLTNQTRVASGVKLVNAIHVSSWHRPFSFLRHLARPWRKERSDGDKSGGVTEAGLYAEAEAPAVKTSAS
jgi:NDP-sugar pyrophosphorylase family protein